MFLILFTTTYFKLSKLRKLDSCSINNYLFVRSFSTAQSMQARTKKTLVAMVSDEVHPIHTFIQSWLTSRGFEFKLCGALQTGKDESWVTTTVQAAQSVVEGRADTGIFFCWSGTGASMAANKVRGIRAALSTDVETVRLARVWNHANVLVLSNRSLTEELAAAMLDEWFFGAHDLEKGAVGVQELTDLEDEYMK